MDTEELKSLLPYIFATGHTKYALEAFNLLVHVHATTSPRLAHQVMWSRIVNIRGNQGWNIPVDLHMNTSIGASKITSQVV